jgi:hypothetical protein
MNWIIIVAPLLIVVLVGALAFVGCGLDTTGTLAPELYHDDVFNNPNTVSYWRLDEAPGATTAADSKDGNAGTYHGGVTLGVTGLVHLAYPNLAAQFDGSSGYVSVPHAAALNSPKFTVEAIVTIVGGDGTYRAIASSRDVQGPLDGTGNYFGYALYVSDQNRWEAWLHFGTSGQTIVQVGAPDAVKVGGGPPRGPYYVAMTYDGATLTLYVNPIDQADPDQVKSAGSAYQPNTNNQRELRIGAGASEQAPMFFFNGVIDEVAVYKDALDFNTAQRHFAIAMTNIAT